MAKWCFNYESGDYEYPAHIVYERAHVVLVLQAVPGGYEHGVEHVYYAEGGAHHEHAHGVRRGIYEGEGIFKGGAPEYHRPAHARAGSEQQPHEYRGDAALHEHAGKVLHHAGGL